jgi:hypothetical protein
VASFPSISPWEYSYTDDLLALRASKTLVISAEINCAAGPAWGVYQAHAYTYTGTPPAPALDSNGYLTEPELTRGLKLGGAPATASAEASTTRVFQDFRLSSSTRMRPQNDSTTALPYGHPIARSRGQGRPRERSA